MEVHYRTLKRVAELTGHTPSVVFGRVKRLPDNMRELDKRQVRIYESIVSRLIV